jgi:hypothetical protein
MDRDILMVTQGFTSRRGRLDSIQSGVYANFDNQVMHQLREFILIST